jgi:AcrR family transcriptional regulator
MTQDVVVPPVSARRAQTRARLLQAAAAVFAERGVNGASVEEITDAAGFTRGAFYSNFADKSALVLAMLNESLEEQYAVAERAVAELTASGNRNVEELVNETLTALERSHQPARVATLLDQELKLHAAREPGLRAAYLAVSRRAARQLEDLIAGALAHLDLELTVPADHATRLILSLHAHELQEAMFADAPVDHGPLRTLLLAITRPAAAAPADAAAEA